MTGVPVPTEKDYLDAARANAAVYFAESGLEGFGHYFDETAKRIAKRPDFRAAVDSAYAAGQRACPKCAEDARGAAEWAAAKAAMSPEELHARCMHPGYEYRTTEGQRKAWDDADTPPEGDGWVRNTHRGNPGEGWERFDYTEESYWMRPAAPDA